MRRFLLAFLLSAFAASAFAGNFFDYRPPGGGGGVTFPLFAPDGSQAVPSYSFTNCAGPCGMWLDAAGGLKITQDDSGSSGIIASLFLDPNDSNSMEFRLDDGTFYTSMFWEPGNTFLESQGTGSNNSKITVNAGTPPLISIVSTDGTNSGNLSVGTNGFRVLTAGSKPTCDATTRFYQWQVTASLGVADTFEVCTKDVNDVYAWRPVGLIFPLLAPTGAFGAPAYSFSADTDDGLYLGAANSVTLVSRDVPTSRTVTLQATSGNPPKLAGSVAGDSPQTQFITNGTTSGIFDMQVVGGANYRTDASWTAAATQSGFSMYSKFSATNNTGIYATANNGTPLYAVGIKVKNLDALVADEKGIDIVDRGTKPTCDSTARGRIWYDEGGAGVADTFEVCAKNAADTYAWVALATP